MYISTAAVYRHLGAFKFWRENILLFFYEWISSIDTMRQPYY